MAKAPNPAPDHEREKWTAQLEFEREKWRGELALKEREQAQRQEELDQKKEEARLSRWTNPLVLAIIGATLTGLANVIAISVTSHYQLELEKTKSAATLDLEHKKSTATLDLEERKSKASLGVEQAKSEATRILEMIKTNDPDKAAENLKFLVESGLIADDILNVKIRKFLADRKPGTGPFLTGPAARAVTTYSCNGLAARLNVPQGYAVSVTQDKDRCAFYVNGATDSDAVAAQCHNVHALVHLPAGAAATAVESRGLCTIDVTGSSY